MRNIILKHSRINGYFLLIELNTKKNLGVIHKEKLYQDLTKWQIRRLSRLNFNEEIMLRVDNKILENTEVEK